MLDLPPPNLGQRERRFMGAVFLIGSGTVEAYDRPPRAYFAPATSGVTAQTPVRAVSPAAITGPR